MALPPVECMYVVESNIREWKSGNSSFRVPQPVPVVRFLYELCWTMVRGELPFQKCKAALDSVEFSEKVSAEELGSAFADVITQLAQDITLAGEYRARLLKLIFCFLLAGHKETRSHYGVLRGNVGSIQKLMRDFLYDGMKKFRLVSWEVVGKPVNWDWGAKWLVESALVPLRLFQERCEEEFLWEAEMIKIKAQELKSKEVRVNTRLLYQQTKFNLLREESEGYAKLPENSVFVELIPIFPKSHASQILGFKFQYYQRIEVNSPVPFGLYKLTALLVKENFIDLDSIYAHLLPKEDEAFEHYGSFSSKRLDEASRIGKINLAATGKDLMDDEKQGDVSIDLFAALDMESEAVNERSPELENNQTLGLLTGFLSVGDWYHAHVLFDRLSPLNPVELLPICNSLFRLIEESISSSYSIVRQNPHQSLGASTGSSVDAIETTNLPVGGSFIDLPRELFQMLATAGPYLYRDTILLQKVCRVLRGYYTSAIEFVNSVESGQNPELVMPAGNRVPHLHLKEARLRIEEALGTCLLPSLQLIPANPAVGQGIWEVMNLLPYEVRYRLYGEWERDDEKIPMVLAARQTAKLDTRRILKRLAKENLKQLGRMVAKLAHANPMTVLRTIVHQIEAYRDMITPVVDAFKYLTQLEYDILEYVVIERLAQGGRDKLKDDGLNLSDWLQSLASFWGHLCMIKYINWVTISQLAVEIEVGFQFPSQVHDNIVDWEVKDPGCCFVYQIQGDRMKLKFPVSLMLPLFKIC
ncbi:THO complex subunit 2 [Cucumis melo var. makuwa]|uniref:THO complex subunit 2 n=1 Tax=Cucumis melo var. makuwa TaxID=1194695 RepID=A0A5D3CRW6_CUCMM|nr:THO complex subunit 2 [Cucumis melo var. makuwa]